MPRFHVSLPAGCLLALAASAPVVRADPTWYYNTQANVDASASSGGVQQVNFSAISSPTQQVGYTTSSTLVNLIPSLNSLNLTSPVMVNEKYSITVTLADTIASGPALTWVVKGQLQGMYGPGVDTLVNTFSGSTSHTFSFVPPNGISGDIFTMALNPVALPGSTNASTGTSPTEGAITVTVTGTPGPIGEPVGGPVSTPPLGGTPGSPSQAPEPSTMLLSCLGLSAMGAAAWRKRRKGAASLALSGI